jgi:cold shock CspA family protein
MEQSNTGSIKYSQEESYMGCVKWFNNHKGFGYVTVKSGPLVNEDIFTHHSAIILQNGRYKYLAEGEYVHIKVMDCVKEGFNYQAKQVMAPCENGTLMCEIKTAKKTREFQERSEETQDI